MVQRDHQPRSSEGGRKSTTTKPTHTCAGCGFCFSRVHAVIHTELENLSLQFLFGEMSCPGLRFCVKYGGRQAAGFKVKCLLLKLSFRHVRAARRAAFFARKNKRDLFGLRTPPTDMSALRKKSAIAGHFRTDRPAFRPLRSKYSLTISVDLMLSHSCRTKGCAGATATRRAPNSPCSSDTIASCTGHARSI